MSSVAQPPRPTQAPSTDRNEITIVSHSNLFYWWPVWAVGFLMAILTAIDGHRMVTVPKPNDKDDKDAVVAAASKEVVILKPGGKESKTLADRDVIVLPKGTLAREDSNDPTSVVQPKLHMARSKYYGVIFAMTLLLVIFITNVPLRGMWSVVVIITVVMLALIFHLADWWESIVRHLSYLDIRINMGGYLLVSSVLFGIWLFTLLFFDRQVYLTFTPGQLKVCTEIGGGEKVYDAVGMTLEKQKSDVFRHRILGLGSGDLVVKTSGAQAHHFDLPNVLFINKKVQMIEDMIKRKSVIEAK
jgi:hypothetical protein